MRVLTVVGARPQFIKASAVSAVLRRRHREILVHTGQHYDYEMSEAFFADLAIPQPDHRLEIGSGTHGFQTGRMLERIEEVLLVEKPDWVLVYGDTNSTLSGALAAAKLRIPVAHVEAGLRSFNKAMPEELNRIVTDHVSSLLLCPSLTAEENLLNEGIREGVRLTGDVMYDALHAVVDRARLGSAILEELRLEEDAFSLATVHRAENTDDPTRLASILSGLSRVQGAVVLAAHPRTLKAIERLGLSLGRNILLRQPLRYLDMCRLLQAAKRVFTDSGGLQKEAYWLGTPCVTLRDETEWVETVAAGWNVLAGADSGRIAAEGFRGEPAGPRPMLYGGDGAAASRCVSALEQAHGDKGV
jgi:UDP-GlcNAc3NAcA epimerase